MAFSAVQALRQCWPTLPTKRRPFRRHYLSDVLAGLLLGVATVGIVTRVGGTAEQTCGRLTCVACPCRPAHPLLGCLSYAGILCAGPCVALRLGGWTFLLQGTYSISGLAVSQQQSEAAYSALVRAWRAVAAAAGT